VDFGVVRMTGFYSPSDKDVEEEFTKRLELLGGTIEDPND